MSSIDASLLYTLCNGHKKSVEIDTQNKLKQERIHLVFRTAIITGKIRDQINCIRTISRNPRVSAIRTSLAVVIVVVLASEAKHHSPNIL